MVVSSSMEAPPTLSNRRRVTFNHLGRNSSSYTRSDFSITCADPDMSSRSKSGPLERPQDPTGTYFAFLERLLRYFQRNCEDFLHLSNFKNRAESPSIRKNESNIKSENKRGGFYFPFFQYVTREALRRQPQRVRVPYRPPLAAPVPCHPPPALAGRKSISESTKYQFLKGTVS